MLRLLPILIAVAVIGYSTGHSHAAGGTVTKQVPTFVANVVLEHPQDWQPATGAPVISGLAMTHQVSLAPHGDGARVGLLAGVLPGGEPGPLPRKLVAAMQRLPDIQIVRLQEVQAYRYEHLALPGAPDGLVLYVIPNPEGAPTALACYGSQALATYSRACQQTVVSLGLLGQPKTDELTPDAIYAHRLGKLIASLDAHRAILRRSMARSQDLAAVGNSAADLAAAFDSAGISLAALEPSPAAERAQASLGVAIRRARDAYSALAAAAAGDSARLAGAPKRVAEAEAGVDSALETFLLMGYRRP